MPDGVRPRRALSRPARASVAAGLTLLFSAATTTWALASFLDGASATATLSTSTLAPPTSLGAGLCLLGSVTLNWTATPSTWADGYEIRWGTTSGGPYTTGSTTSVLPTKTVTGLSLLTTYYFVVRASYGNWRSVYTTQRAVSC